MTINKLTMTSMVAGLMMSACNTFSPEKTTQEWDLVQIGAQQVTPGPVAPYVVFEKGKLYGFTGCNRINGGFKIKGEKFNADNVATTMRMCPDAIYEQDFLKGLNEAVTIKGSKEGFTLLNGNGQVILSFTPHLLNVEELEGQWELETMNGTDIQNEEDVPFVNFDIQKKMFSGFTGCNRLNSNLDLEALGKCSIDLSNCAMTRKFCQNNKVESEFVKSLMGSKAIRVVNDKLYIYSDEEGYSLIFKK